MEKSNVTEAEYADALEEEHLDGQFVQKFLRAIIECYPSPNARPKSLAQRIDAAQEALFGKVLVVGRDTGDDEDALRFMADEFVRDRKGPAISIGPNPFAWLAANPREARSIVDLAREAKGRFPKSSSVKSLQNKFSQFGLGLCKATCYGSDVPGSIHYQALREIQKILKPLGINLKLD